VSAAHKIRLARIVREAGGCPTPALYKHDPAGTVLLPLCALPVQTDAFGSNVSPEPTDLGPCDFVKFYRVGCYRGLVRGSAEIRRWHPGTADPRRRCAA